MQILWIQFWTGTYQDFLSLIAAPKKKTLVFTPNPEILVHAERDGAFHDSLSSATYNVIDGTGLYLGADIERGGSLIGSFFRLIFARSSHKKLYGERICGSDLTGDLVALSAQKHISILILDNKVLSIRSEFDARKQEMQKQIPELLREIYPGLDARVVFDGEETPESLAKLIQAEHIRYVFSCLGMKRQETRLREIWNFLPEETPVVGLGIGASIDFLLGLQKRSPRIFRKLWLEWVYRLALQPRLRAKRIYTALVTFPLLVAKKMWSKKDL